MTDTIVSIQRPRTSRNGLRCALLSGFFVLLTAGLLASPLAGPLRYGFPALALVVSFVIFRLSRPFYAGFVVWLWMLAPLVRRVVEYRAGGAASLIIASPFLACAVPVLLDLAGLGELLSIEGYPVLFAGAGIAYGLGIGLLLRNHLSLVATQLAFWIAPLLFASFLFRFRSQLREIRASLEKAFLWGTLVIGAYGLYQYLILAPWDALWIETSGLASIGFPEPQQMRVFSTMNSPQGLAAFLVAGIFIALRSRSKIKWLAIPFASLSLLLTQARTGWLGFVFGLAYLTFYLPVRQRLQIAVFAALSVILVFVALEGPQKEMLTARIQTLSAPNEDGSVSARTTGYAVLLPEMLTSPFGSGIGIDETAPDSPTSKSGEGLGIGDSAVIAILFGLGIPGTLSYLAGIFVAIVGSRNRFHADAAELLAFRAIIVAMAVSSVATDVLQGSGGFLTWMVLTISSLHVRVEGTLQIAPETAASAPFAMAVADGQPASLGPRIS